VHASAHHGALDSLDPKAYVDFLIGTMQIVTRKESWGIDWASDNQVRSRARVAEATERAPARHASAHHGALLSPQVIAGHFKMRRSAGQAEHESTPRPRIELERPPACKCSPRRPRIELERPPACKCSPRRPPVSPQVCSRTR